MDMPNFENEKELSGLYFDILLDVKFDITSFLMKYQLIYFQIIHYTIYV